MQLTATKPASTTEADSAARPRRALFGACLAHVVHDGYTDLLYVLLPVWQAQFGLSYAGLAILRCLYYGTMGALQVPADRLAAGLSDRVALALSTLVAAAGFLVIGLTGSLWGLCAGLVLSGIGSSLQHPRASLLVSEAYGGAARGPLGLYNFAGDIGKAVFPVFVALLLGMFAASLILEAMALVGLVAAATLLKIIPRRLAPRAASKPANGRFHGTRSRFHLLLAIGALDTATRMGYLLFLPFLIHAKGGADTAVGVSLALVFSGGALGKACCGWLGERFGVVPSVIATETATALLMGATLALPLGPCFLLLPMLGIVLNGTSSILYGTVPELAPPGEASRAFALYYTAVIGSGGLAPIAYGVLGDSSGETTGVAAAALTALATAPLVLGLRARPNTV